MALIEAAPVKADSAIHRIAASDILTVLNRTVFPIVMTILLGIIGFEAERSITKLDDHADRLARVETTLKGHTDDFTQLRKLGPALASLQSSVDTSEANSLIRRTDRDKEMNGFQSALQKATDQITDIWAAISRFEGRLGIVEALEGQAKGHH